MLNRMEFNDLREQSAKMLEQSGVVLTDKEKMDIEIADFGLSEFTVTGLALLVYVNTERVCAKELVMWPRQTCPEHRHPPISKTNPGKEETFRCRSGKVYLYVQGEPAADPKAVAPQGSEAFYTVWHEVVLNPGDQYLIEPNTLHWFQAGDEGAIITEFSTTSLDQYDIFTHPRIERFTTVEE